MLLIGTFTTFSPIAVIVEALKVSFLSRIGVEGCSQRVHRSNLVSIRENLGCCSIAYSEPEDLIDI